MLFRMAGRTATAERSGNPIIEPSYCLLGQGHFCIRVALCAVPIDVGYVHRRSIPWELPLGAGSAQCSDRSARGSASHSTISITVNLSRIRRGVARRNRTIPSLDPSADAPNLSSRPQVNRPGHEAPPSAPISSSVINTAQRMAQWTACPFHPNFKEIRVDYVHPVKVVHLFQTVQLKFFL